MPAPTETQIELTREVLGLKSYSDAQARITALEDAQWAAQIGDNDLWEAKRDKNAVLQGGKAGVFIDPKSALGRIRNRSRLRFSLPAISGNATDADIQHREDGNGVCHSRVVPVKIGW